MFDCFRASASEGGGIGGSVMSHTQRLFKATVTRLCAAAGAVLIAPVSLALADGQVQAPPQGCDQLFRVPGIVWRGSNGSLTLQQLASYAAPVMWLSPDEPALQRRSGPEIRVPTAMPFETPADGPVMYYQLTRIAEAPVAGSTAFQPDPTDRGQSMVNLDAVTALVIEYIAYFPEEAGVGRHQHDVEPTEFRLVVSRADGEFARTRGFVCDSTDYLIVVTRVTGQAHGNPWYYNVLNVDDETRLPIHLLVEEGKHATATDKNADGYFTPGYDVSVRTNDAWGVRDTIRGGALLSGKYEGWMSKVRTPEYRVLPPLPRDSLLRQNLVTRTGEVLPNTAYELRPYPPSSAATDALLHKKIEEKEVENWPIVRASTSFAPILEALDEGRELKPYSVAYRYDGSPGLAVAFPLFFVKNFQDPLSAGYIVNRLYFSDTNLRDWGWMAMYTPSASRWFDEYLAMGIDIDRFDKADGTEDSNKAFVLEAGVKLRFRAPHRVLDWITPFWGLRAGIKNVGAFDIDHLTYVLEFGAGVW